MVRVPNSNSDFHLFSAAPSLRHQHSHCQWKAWINLQGKQAYPRPRPKDKTEPEVKGKEWKDKREDGNGFEKVQRAIESCEKAEGLYPRG